MDAPSRYTIRESTAGLRIEGADRPPVEITPHPYCLEAAFVGDLGQTVRERFGLFEFGKLLEFVARGLMRDWRGNENWYGARAWAQQQTARALARRLRERWLTMLAKVDPYVLAVQRAVFAATFGGATLANEPELYERPFLVADVLRFPAAAVALRNALQLTHDHALTCLHRSKPAQEMHALARRLGLSLHVCAVAAEEPTTPAVLDRLADWKALFSDDGLPYRSLNRTLMNLPGRVPHRLVCNLRRMRLERPLSSRLELLAAALYAGIRAEREDGERRPDHSRLFLHAEADQVRLALERVSRHLRQPLDARKSADVRQAVHFLADFPEVHKGTLAGLAEKAVRWHRDRQRHQADAFRRRYGAETPTRLPPIALPGCAGVRFLDTVGAICLEAEQMQHCVASYIDLAVDGNCYLFHVSHKGEEATVEVGTEGRVRQSQGPRNHRNKAAAYGKRMLTAWAAKLPGAGGRGYTPRGEDIPF